MTTQERASKEIETHQSNFISVLNITKDLNLQLDGKFMMASKVHSRSVDVDTVLPSISDTASEVSLLTNSTITWSCQVQRTECFPKITGIIKNASINLGWV